jgi:hypothetical protein
VQKRLVARVEAAVVAVGPGIAVGISSLEEEKSFARRLPIGRGTKLREVNYYVLLHGDFIGGTLLSPTQVTVSWITSV